MPNFQIADLLGGALSAVTQILAALWHVSRGGEGRFVDVSMTHATHAHNVIAQVALANEDSARNATRNSAAGSAGNTARNPTEETAAGAGLLNGGVPCYNLYRTLDGRWLAVGALELKFWESLCMALDRPEWATRHWSLGQAIGGPDAVALTQELADVIGTRALDEWVALLEPLDCCVSPVLTAAEAAQHPLFHPQAHEDHDEPDELTDESGDRSDAHPEA